MMNGGGIRFGLPKGDKKEHILTALPYKNNIYVVKIDGKTLLEFFLMQLLKCHKEADHLCKYLRLFLMLSCMKKMKKWQTFKS